MSAGAAPGPVHPRRLQSCANLLTSDAASGSVSLGKSKTGRSTRCESGRCRRHPSPCLPVCHFVSTKSSALPQCRYHANVMTVHTWRRDTTHLQLWSPSTYCSQGTVPVPQGTPVPSLKAGCHPACVTTLSEEFTNKSLQQQGDQPASRKADLFRVKFSNLMLFKPPSIAASDQSARHIRHAGCCNDNLCKAVVSA